MPLDPVLLVETRGWLAKAQSDLRAAEHEFRAAPPLLDDIVFHCQQAAEKAMKGFLTWHGCPFRKTHSLEELGEQCLLVDSTLRDLVDRAVPLTEYAWKFRYPGEPEGPAPMEAEEAFGVARDVFAAVLARLPVEARP
jgi:HEPN domain-containing protein